MEDIVLLETAKLAKQRGFDWKVVYHYKDKELIRNGNPYNINSPEEQALWSLEMTSAPTQAMLQKWLRNHLMFIHVSIETIGSDEWVFVYNVKWVPKENHEDKRRCLAFKEVCSFKEGFGTYTGGWYTYEEALEEALKFALKLI